MPCSWWSKGPASPRSLSHSKQCVRDRFGLAFDRFCASRKESTVLAFQCRGDDLFEYVFVCPRACAGGGQYLAAVA